MKNISNITNLEKADPALCRKISRQSGCLTREDVAKVVKGDRLCRLLVRCSNGRFIAPAQDVLHFIAIIEEHDKLVPQDNKNRDFVRDIQICV